MDMAARSPRAVSRTASTTLAPRSTNARVAASPKTADELGDLLFSIVNLTRHLKLDAEELLTAATDKFSTRFKAVEAIIKAKGKEMADCTLDELDAAWDEVKRK